MKIATILLLIALIISCGEPRPEIIYPIYEYRMDMAVPDSLLQKQRDWIAKCVTAENEDQQMAIIQATWTSEDLFGSLTEGLLIKVSRHHMHKFHPYSRLSDEQKQIFSKLKSENYELHQQLDR